MKKKVSRSSHKIFKHEKIRVSSCLINVLRPQVYITDSSRFKKLVQELTGNGRTEVDHIISPPVSGSSSTTTTFDHDHDHDHQQPAEPESFFFDSRMIAAAGSASVDVGHHQGDNNKLLIACKNLESWLLDCEDTCSLYNIFDSSKTSDCPKLNQ